MGRRLGKVLGAHEICKLKLLTFFQFRKDLVFLLFLIRLDIDGHEAVELQSGCRHRKLVSARSDLYGCCLIDSRGHAARREALPDQLVEAELVSCQGFFYLYRC